MRVGTTPTFTFKLPFGTDVVQKAKITFRQNNKVVLEKTDDCVVDADMVKVSLAQEETFMFTYPGKAEVQLRILTQGNDALASAPFLFLVEECLDKEVL